MPESDGLSDYPDDGRETDFKPLTALQASQWRARYPSRSMWVVVGLQVLTGLVCTVLAGLLGGLVVAKSVAYGAFVVIFPAAMFVHGVRGGGAASAGSAWIRFCVWELAKVVLTVAMLLAAPRLLAPLNWLALLFGMVVTMKVYWVALWLRPKPPSRAVTN
jgi:ATP synthase protein I